MPIPRQARGQERVAHAEPLLPVDHRAQSPDPSHGPPLTGPPSPDPRHRTPVTGESPVRARGSPSEVLFQLSLHALEGVVHLFKHLFRRHAELAELGA